MFTICLCLGIAIADSLEKLIRDFLLLERRGKLEVGNLVLNNVAFIDKWLRRCGDSLPNSL